MPNRNVTAQKALEALHTLTSLAVPQPAPSDPIEYGTGPGQVPMTNFNAPPMLIVWLFLVTNKDYLDQLDTGRPFDGTNVKSTSDIAKATNLTPDAVGSVLNVYRNNAPATKQAFRNVAAEFNTFTSGLGYPSGHCPGNGQAMLQLAEQGATVDPDADSFAALQHNRRQSR